MAVSEARLKLEQIVSQCNRGFDIIANNQVQTLSSAFKTSCVAAVSVIAFSVLGVSTLGLINVYAFAAAITFLALCYSKGEGSSAPAHDFPSNFGTFLKQIKNNL